MKKSIQGIDTIRFFCALWVVLGHMGGFIPLPYFFGGGENDALHWFILNANKSLFSAPAAVIVFFVVSGFCIHYTSRHTEGPEWGSYYLRRYIRIGVPLATFAFLAYAIDLAYVFNDKKITWSLISELIYYTLYPAILYVRKRFGWKVLLVGAFIASGLVILQNPMAQNYPSYGSAFNWLLGLPCWLLGVLLADTLESGGVVKTQNIWMWRLVVWFSSSLCMILRFRTPIGYPITLNFFAILVYFWLRQEIDHARRHPPKLFLEWLGSWSYSIYLMHMLTIKETRSFIPPSVSPIASWVIIFTAVMIISYLFFLLVESPAHKVAKKIGRTRHR